MFVKFFKDFDFWILFCLLALAAFGLTIIWSVKPDLLLQQALFWILGLLFFFLFSKIDYRIFGPLKWVFYFLSVFLLLLTFFGVTARGATRWIEIAGFRFQPSELIKPFMIIFFADFFLNFSPRSFKNLLTGFLLLAPILILVFKQPDLGNTIISALIFLGIVFAAGLRIFWALLGTGFVGGLLPLAWRFLAPFQRQRIESFLSPQADPLGAGYHLLQSVITAGSGQLLGRGLGRGTQTHLLFLPERHTDFIFASLSEELGFVGSVLLLILYVVLLLRILQVAKNSQDNFGYFICLGVFTLVLSQVAINIGMNLGILPITGITLPLVSYGGSSILSISLALGLVVSVSRFSQKRSLEIGG